MLETLERGIKGGKWFSLMDKVWKMENLQSALKRVVQNKAQPEWTARKQSNICGKAPAAGTSAGHAEKGQYTPNPSSGSGYPSWAAKNSGRWECRRWRIASCKRRCEWIEPVFENIFAEHSYGFRPRRGAKDALRRVDQLLDTGRVWVVDADLKATSTVFRRTK